MKTHTPRTPREAFEHLSHNQCCVIRRELNESIDEPPRTVRRLARHYGVSKDTIIKIGLSDSTQR